MSANLNDCQCYFAQHHDHPRGSQYGCEFAAAPPPVSAPDGATRCEHDFRSHDGLAGLLVCRRCGMRRDPASVSAPDGETCKHGWRIEQCPDCGDREDVIAQLRADLQAAREEIAAWEATSKAYDEFEAEYDAVKDRLAAAEAVCEFALIFTDAARAEVQRLTRALRKVRRNIERDHAKVCAKTHLGIGCLWCETNVVIDAALSPTPPTAMPPTPKCACKVDEMMRTWQWNDKCPLHGEKAEPPAATPAPGPDKDGGK